MIRPGDTVTLTVSWHAIRVDQALADWLHANPWAVRRHTPRGQMPTIDVLAGVFPR